MPEATASTLPADTYKSPVTVNNPRGFEGFSHLRWKIAFSMEHPLTAKQIQEIEKDPSLLFDFDRSVTFVDIDNEDALKTIAQKAKSFRWI